MILPAKQQTESMRLSDLLGNITILKDKQDVMIEGLCLDSREVKTGSLFFAMPGSRADGREHIKSAIQRGAAAVLYESQTWSEIASNHTPQLGIHDLRKQIGYIADVFYQKPSTKVHVVGITGTNAKTSCAYLTTQALEILGKKSAIVGTLGSGFHSSLRAGSLTTPDPISLHRKLAQLSDEGADYICLEVSSHALDQGRTHGVKFGTVVFTNLSQDHLDYHRTHRHYRDSKAKLFTEYNSRCAILNVDEDLGRELSTKTKNEYVLTYGKRDSDVQLEKAVAHSDGLTATINILGRTITVQSSLLGSFNAINLTTVAAILHSLGFNHCQIEQALSQVKAVPGRMEQISSVERPSIYIDYAHTPAALEAALSSLKEFSKGQIWCIFGCGGGRDQKKRSMMGKISEKLSDEVVLTDDNPRNEAPDSIMDAIAQGMKSQPKRIPDRKSAIEFALKNAARCDSILIAGKGHETTQVYRDQSFAFSDKQVVLELLGARS